MSSADSAMLPRIHKAWSHAPAATWIRRHEPVKGRIGVSKPGGGAVQAYEADESPSESLKHNVTLKNNCTSLECRNYGIFCNFDLFLCFPIENMENLK